MSRRKTLPGLHQKETGYWHIDKIIVNYGRYCESTRTKNYKEAERRAIRWIKEKEDVAIHGKRTRITFNEAAAIYINKEAKKPKEQRLKSIKCDANDLKKVMPSIGTLYLDQIYQDTIQPYIDNELKKGRKATTINRSLRTVSKILKLCATSWRDEHHTPYLSMAPLIKQLPENDKKSTPPIEYSEEQRLLNELNPQYQDYWHFATNTGLREKNQTTLKWEYEVNMPLLGTSAFIIPARINGIKHTKNGKDFLLVLNSRAREILERYRGQDNVYVFPSPKGGAYCRFNNKHFRNARDRAKLNGIIRWHSARATFATRLRALKISEEDRKQLIGHSSQSVTTQYSWADIRYLIECVEKLCSDDTSEDERMDLTALFRIEKN